MNSTIQQRIEEFEKNYSNLQMMRDIWQDAKGYRAKLVFAFIVRISRDVAALYPVYASAKIITLLASPQKEGVAQEFLVLIISALIAGVWMRVALIIGNRILLSTLLNIQQEVNMRGIKIMSALPLAWHEQESTGVRAHYISKGAAGEFTIIRDICVNALPSVIVMVISCVIIGMTDWRILLYMVTYIAIHVLIFKRITRHYAEVQRQENEKQGRMNGVFFEAINNTRTIKVLDLVNQFSRIAKKYSDEYIGAYYRSIVVFQKRHWLFALFQVMRVLALIYIGYGIIGGRYELGFFLLFQDYFGKAGDAADTFSMSLEELIKAKQGMAKMKSVTHEVQTVQAGSGTRKMPKGWKTIEVKNLEFAYEENRVLQSISFRIARGEKVGIVGLSGAGKSTLMKLLLREYDGYKGDIAIDGVQIRDIDLRSYYRSAAVVLQDTEVFNLSVRENITIALDGPVNEKRLKGVLDIAHVSDFVKKLSNGLDTMIGEKGVKLSGGERQRLGIARAIYKQPEILFLDEATSHLDLESEEKIQDSLRKFFKEVTAVVIAHRLTTIKEMDRIIVLENGAIIEEGSFAVLMKKKGRFAELWEKQKL